MKNILTIFNLFWVMLTLPLTLISGAGENQKNHKNTWLESLDQCYVINPERKMQAFLPWESVSMAAITCPDDITINLKSGECGRVVNNFGWSFSNLTPPDITINPNESDIIKSTKYCNTGQTTYSRTFHHAGPTDMRIKSIKLGVFESSNHPIVTYRFLSTDGKLYGSYQDTIPTLNLAIHNRLLPGSVNIKIPANSDYVMQVVTNAPYVSVFKIGRNDLSNKVGFAEATITAANCESNFELQTDPIYSNYTPNSTVFGLIGEPDDYKLVNQNNSYKEGSYFPIGDHVMSYIVTDAAGTSTACSFDIDIKPFANPAGTLACNDLVQVSLEGNCELVITPDMLLEGGEYGCYSDYEVQIIDNRGVNLGNKVTKAQIGQKLKTQIFNKAGNSCWGEIEVKDKYGPLLECGNVYTTCTTDLKPGSNLSPRVPVQAIITNGIISDATANSKSFVIPVGPVQGSSITDLDVYMNISHQNISDLAANITSPDGVTVPLFVRQTTCNGKDFVVTFNDESPNIISCEASLTPAIAGNFRPTNLLSIYDGKPLSGNWTVTIYDMVAGNGGTVNDVHLVFSQTGGKVPFPTTKNITSATLIADNTYVLQGLDACGPATLTFTDEVIDESCLSIYSKVIKRCWGGFDSYGNNANSCCQYIYVYRNSLSTLQFPPNYDGLNGNPRPLSCEKYGDIIPPIDSTGKPQGDFCGNVQLTTPVDIRIDICKRSYKLLRTHKVVDWCTGDVILHNQVIKVMDTLGPVLQCPDNLTISTDNYACTATYVAAKPKVTSECSDILEYFLEYKNDLALDPSFITTGVNQPARSIAQLPLGDNTVRWTVTDECGNISICTYKVHVRDDVKPNAVCDQFTVASITGNGRAVVEAKTFDDGSNDNCGIAKFEARKMSDKCGFGTTLFTPTVEFCCEEVNTSVMVEMRVTDIHGNSNTCMVEVRVQDKLPPYITKCPKDITLDCQADYKDLTVTGIPEFIDNCSAELVKCDGVLPYCDEDSISQCGTGKVIRKWTVVDKQGLRNSCIQVITLVDKKPFTQEDIIWPDNYSTTKCHSNLDPGNLPINAARPRFADDNCSLVAAHYKDQVFKLVDGACEKILRTWTVIDWCTYNDKNPVLGQGWYERIQILKIQNDIPPIFEFACLDRTIPSYGACQDKVEFTMTAIDDCPEDNVNLVWKYELYTENGTTPIITKHTNKFIETLANGKYRVRWTVEDRCGNLAYCNHYINLVESKKPTPYCITSLTTAVMNSDGTISIWAKDYDKGGFDNCTPKEDILFTFFNAKPVGSLLNTEHYFKGNGILATKAEYLAGTAQIWKPFTKSSGILFDCSDIPNGKSQEVSIDVSLTDLAGNQDYCTIQIVLQDNSNTCPDANTNNVAVTGRIITPTGNSMPGTNILLESNVSELNKSIYTDNAGQYAFASLPKSYNYTISAQNNQDVLNGVSTLDLVLIQKHILGLESFNDAKKIIAADVDNSAKVSASDLVALRKVILGITNDFPNGQKSWRFVTSNHVFSNIDSPFPFTEKYILNQLNDSKVNQNFQAIKVGDVNFSAIVNAQNQIVEARSKKTFELETSTWTHPNGVIQVPVYAKNLSDVLGFQFTLQFDQHNFSIKDVVAAGIPVTDQNFNLQRAENGIITTSWHAESPTTVGENTPLFIMEFVKTNRSQGIENQISISSGLTKAEAYDTSYGLMPIRLSQRNSTSNINSFALKQNAPNPFKEATSITFVLPEAAPATITISNVAGKVVKVISGDYQKGENSILLTKDDLNATGILLYKVESGKYTDTKKMIIIE
jgi:subtilisin-like proprotein convertase family protein